METGSADGTPQLTYQCMLPTAGVSFKPTYLFAFISIISYSSDSEGRLTPCIHCSRRIWREELLLTMVGRLTLIQFSGRRCAAEQLHALARAPMRARTGSGTTAIRESVQTYSARH
jgi:hypothetical protein